MRHKAYIAATGMFDGVHLGHSHLLGQLTHEAALRGLAPLVVTFGRHPLATIAPERVPPTLMHAHERIQRLRALGVDVLVLDFDRVRHMTARQFMALLSEEYSVRALLMGFNHTFGSDRLKDFDSYRTIGADIGVEVLRASEVPGMSISSSRVRKALSDGLIRTANDALGREYTLTGTVVGGQRIGRTIGFPTANIKPFDPGQLVPADGVYACRAVIGDLSVPAMVNIGLRPTVDASASPLRTIEAHLIGFDNDIYGRELTLQFVARLRGERRFPNLEALRAQLSQDRDDALAALGMA